uniref:Protein ENHANCED DISEASE RESISTANCE 2 C-terminal domain-containing protein n=1 Tax=Opuntia streptacantha TaxID=393608 RepID=A0A7C8Z1N7_OPUST
MDKHDGEEESEWMRRVKSEGAVPYLEPDNCPKGWASPPGKIFMVRGPEYFTTRVKIPAGDYLLKPLGFDWIKGSSKIGNILKDRSYRVRKILDKEFQGKDKPFVWAFNLQVPSKENYSAIAYFVATEPLREGSLMDQFVKGDDGFRDSRLKLIANIVKGPWLVKKAVGEQAICIIGRALNCKYCIGKNFLEVDIDIGSSVVASAIVHLAFGYVTTLTVDLAFLIESQTDSELPEKLLGAFRFSELQPDSAQSYEASSAESTPTSTPRLGMRLWKTLGQGFSQLLHQGVLESGPDSGSPHINGTDPSKNGTAENDPTKNGTAGNDPSKNGTAGNDPSKNGTAENDPSKNGTAENDPSKNGTAENDPSKKWNCGE